MDENLSGLGLADILNAHGEQYGCTFVTFPERHEGADDEDMPAIAREVGAAALLTINVLDFGAKEQYFRALVAAGVSVVVLRIRSSDRPDIEYITTILTKHVRRIARILDTIEQSVVISVTKDKVRPASLQEILDRGFT